MCTIERLHIKIKQKGNKVDSNHFKDLPPAFIDDYIYEGMFNYIELFYAGKNIRNYNIGFETTSQRTDMLKHLVTSQELTTESSNSENGLIVTRFNLPDDYMHWVRVIGNNSCNGYSIEVVQHEDLSSVLGDSYKGPSDKWKRAIAVFRGSALYLYTESTPTTITVEYIQKPIKPFIGNYDTLEFINGDTTYPNSSSSKIDPNWPEEYCDILADIVVQNIMGDIGDYNRSQYNQQKINNITF